MSLSLGLDIGSHNIKLIELDVTKDSVRLVAAGSAPTPPKAMSASVPANNVVVAATIKKLVKETGAKAETIHIALPESKVFTRVIEVPALSDRELTSAIKFEAEQYIPLPLDQANIDYTVLRNAQETGTNKMEVLLVGAPKSLLETYLSILELAELTAATAETEIIAAARAIARSAPGIKSSMIVELGAQTTDLAIIRGGILSFTRSLAGGGDALTRALAQGLEFNEAQAEEYKRTYGLQSDKLEGKLVSAVAPVMDSIVNEIRRGMTSYEERYKEKVQVVLLAGGTARLPGMVTYLATALGVEVQLANPWVGITKEERFKVLNTEGPNFCVAVGLALKAS